MIILDTDAVTFLQRRDNATAKRLQARLTALSSEEEIVTTVVTYEEQTRGWFALFSQAKNSASLIAAYERLLHHLDDYKKIRVIPYSSVAEVQFQELRRQKIRIGTRDLRIASIALSLGATVFTRNLQDFGQVPKLLIEDWTK